MFERRIKSMSTHQVTGRGTIKTVSESEGVFRVGQKLFIDDVKYRIVSIETSIPSWGSFGLVVTEIK